MILLALAALPGLLWDRPPATAPELRDAGVRSVYVAAEKYEDWKSVNGISIEPADLRKMVKLPSPAVEYRPNVASATRSPWLVSNGWRFLRSPEGRFLYDAEGPEAALAAAEAYCFGADALVRTDDSGLKPFQEMLGFLGRLEANGPVRADIGFVDDGSAAASEIMNLMVRNNLLFRVLSRPDPALKLTVRLGSKELPLEDAKNPVMAVHEIRARLTDEKRSLRLYGSAVVVGRLTALSNGVRVHLLNYAGAERKVDGVRIRVLGHYAKHRLAAAGSPNEQLLDYLVDHDATEFTLPELRSYAVIDLTR